MVTPAATRLADETWLRRHLRDERVVITDVTPGEGVLAVMGPGSRDLIQALSPDDFSTEAFPFGHARPVEIGMGLARAHRVTYVGELGWELYMSADMAAHVFEIALGGRPCQWRQALRDACHGHLPDRKGLPPFRARHHF